MLPVGSILPLKIEPNMEISIISKKTAHQSTENTKVRAERLRAVTRRH